MKDVIGNKITIKKASNKCLEGITGKVIDETKNTLEIENEGKTRKILKKGVKLQIENQEGILIQGENLVGLPEDRLKKKSKVKKRW